MYVFFNDTATTEIYTLALHDALPISAHPEGGALHGRALGRQVPQDRHLPEGPHRRGLGDDRRILLTAVHAGGFCRPRRDRKSTRLNSSHANISYAVFCLKKKQYTRPD